jgi:hypothetical protein
MEREREYAHALISFYNIIVLFCFIIFCVLLRRGIGGNWRVRRRIAMN